jgi:hypothetical protein
MDTALVVLTLHAAATAMMTGLIWFVQVVHYPLMARVGREVFSVYEADHVRRTGRVVGPIMMVEMVTALALAAGYAESVPLAMTWSGLILLTIIWLSTAFVQVPCHRRLAQGFEPATWRRLVHSNWARTGLWSVRSGLALAMLLPMGES